MQRAPAIHTHCLHVSLPILCWQLWGTWLPIQIVREIVLSLNPTQIAREIVEALNPSQVVWEFVQALNRTRIMWEIT